VLDALTSGIVRLEEGPGFENYVAVVLRLEVWERGSERPGGFGHPVQRENPKRPHREAHAVEKLQLAEREEEERRGEDREREHKEGGADRILPAPLEVLHPGACPQRDISALLP
jgi:hypothetical protein